MTLVLDSCLTCVIEDLDEAPYIEETVVHRRWCHSNDIRLSFVYYDPVLFKVLKHGIQKAGLKSDTELRASGVRI